ncbi:hypothetical protein Btru_062684 [Bulinus truncatus]|nr:hypothetical protein Btru_062684 [Bulinus truncatus]
MVIEDRSSPPLVRGWRKKRQSEWFLNFQQNVMIGIISKVCLAETSSKSGRPENHDDEIQSLLLSVKLAMEIVACSCDVLMVIEDRSSPPLVRGWRKKRQSEWFLNFQQKVMIG